VICDSRVVTREKQVRGVQRRVKWVRGRKCRRADKFTNNISDAGIDKLYEMLQVLGSQPSSGRRREELAPGMRSFPFGRYVIFDPWSQTRLKLSAYGMAVAISRVFLRVTQNTLIRVRAASEIRLTRWKNSSSWADLPD
jgi:plasmid stabilization system protein ParE